MTTADQYERRMLDLINADRARFGLDPLQPERNLNAAAEAHSEWMLARDVFSHTGVGGSSATERMRDAGFDFAQGWRSAENIAVQSERGASGIADDVADLHRSLMDSPGHRANILHPDLDYIGIGIERGAFDFSSGTYDSVIVTQNFAATGGSVDLDTGRVTALPTPTPDPTPSPEVRAIEGGRGDDVLRGTRADETISGGRGADRLVGRGGDDTLDGGAGRDRLAGGRGEDVFVFGRGDDRDRIRDFEAGTDTLDLRGLGLDGADALRAAVREKGDDLLLRFGDGDAVRLKDVTFDAIADDILI